MAKTFEELLAERSSGGSSGGDKPKPIGVPEDFSTTRRRPIQPRHRGWSGPIPFSGSETVEVVPTFFAGDDYKPAKLTPENIARLQRQLAAGGVLTGKFRIGVWDEPSRNAYRKVLSYANQRGLTDDAEALAELAQTVEFDPGAVEAAERAPLKVNLSNPADIKKLLKSTAKDVLGYGNLDEGTLDRLVATYQSMERQTQTQDYNMRETGGTQVAPPDPSTWAEQQVRKVDPVRADSRSVVSAFDQIAQMMNGGSVEGVEV